MKIPEETLLLLISFKTIIPCFYSLWLIGPFTVSFAIWTLLYFYATLFWSLGTGRKRVKSDSGRPSAWDYHHTIYRQGWQRRMVHFGDLESTGWERFWCIQNFKKWMPTFYQKLEVSYRQLLIDNLWSFTHQRHKYQQQAILILL